MVSLVGRADLVFAVTWISHRSVEVLEMLTVIILRPLTHNRSVERCATNSPRIFYFAAR